MLFCIFVVDKGDGFLEKGVLLFVVSDIIIKGFKKDGSIFLLPSEHLFNRAWYCFITKRSTNSLARWNID